jgi:hypothetical protein
MVNLSIDFGGSGIKAIASTGDQVYGFRIAPEIIEIRSKPPKLGSDFVIDLSKNIWVGYGESMYALGLLARSKYWATIPLVNPKSDYIIPRTLAAVAVVAYKFGLKAFDLNLQLLLPAAEFDRGDTIKLGNEIKAALINFDIPTVKIKGKSTGQIKVKLKSFAAKPEGWGLTKRFLSVGHKYQSSDVACVMFGHRNTSLYLCSGGQPGHYRSNNKGFSLAIEEAKLDPLEGLSNPQMVDESSIAQYWQANKNWLIENWPGTASIAIIGGGPLAVIGDRVCEFLGSILPPPPSGYDTGVSTNGGMPITYTRDINDDLLQCWPKLIDISESDRRQFCDVYCFWAANEMSKRVEILA